MLFSRDEKVHGAGGAPEIMIEQAGQRGLPVVRSVFSGCELTGVGTQQVVQAVPARAAGVHQVRPGQQGERIRGPFQGHGGEGRGGVGVTIGAWVHAEQPEHPRRLGGQAPVRPGGHATDRGPAVATRVEQVEPPVLIRELTGEALKGRARAGGGQFGGHP